MKTLTLKGIIVREVPYGEADKLLNILTREYGLLTVTAKYARRPKRNMLLATSVLTLGEFEISGSESTRYYLSEATIVESFEVLRNDVILLTYCAHIMDLVLDSMRDVSSAEEIFALVLYTMNRLTKPDIDLPLTIHTFELKLLFILGFTPVLHECVVCAKPFAPAPGEKAIFSYTRCGIICGERSCLSSRGEYAAISSATLECMKYISFAQIDKVYSFKLEKVCSDELAVLSSRYICDRLERCYTKLRLLEDFS
ncbi:MAG: DNA repair protein RecO [Saccharofermentanales bacterium]